MRRDASKARIGRLEQGGDFNARTDHARQTMEDALGGRRFGGNSSFIELDNGDVGYQIAGAIWSADGWWDDFPDDRDRVKFRINAAQRMAFEESDAP